MPSPSERTESVRRRNLATVLQLVHAGAAPSRAELTAATGLNRSTIGALVAELAELELVREVEPEASNRVGRPSPRVEPHPSPAVIAINPEVDAVTAAVVGLGARVEHRVRHETSGALSPDAMTEAIAAIVGELRGRARGRSIRGIGLAVPGLVRSSDGLVRWAPHLEWRDAPITELVHEATGLPTSADNDASLGARSEHLFGAGRGVRDLVYLNGGASGIGGGVIVRGEPLRGAGGFAGEFGQNRPGVASVDDRVTEHGTLEDEVSRARLLAAVGLAAADEPTLRGALASATDPGVAREVARQQRVLAVALGNAINVFNPELVVLGGFLATLLALDESALHRAIERMTVPAAWEGVAVRAAALDEDRLLIGAAELAFAGLLADPAGAHPLGS